MEKQFDPEEVVKAMLAEQNNRRVNSEKKMKAQKPQPVDVSLSNIPEGETVLKRAKHVNTEDLKVSPFGNAAEDATGLFEGRRTYYSPERKSPVDDDKI